MASDELDLYGNIEEDFQDETHDVNELYDEEIDTTQHEEDVSQNSPKTTRISDTVAGSKEITEHTGPRVAHYVGNLTWWTSDEDIITAIKSIGINDILEIKFHENRINGQSKGYCVVVLGSYSSVEVFRERFNQVEIHGRKPVVAHCNKINLQIFEKVAQESNNGGVGYEKTSFNPALLSRNTARTKPTGDDVNTTVFRSSRTSLYDANAGVSLSALRHNKMQQQVQVNQASLTTPTLAAQMALPPPGFNPNAPPPNFLQPPGMTFPLMTATAGLPSSFNTAIRPPIIPTGLAHPPSDAVSKLFAQPVSLSHQINEMEFEEQLQRNKIVASSAINRAVQDAANGEFGPAIETLVTAISLLKQSKISTDDRCRILINSLQDTLSGIESKHYSSNSSSSKNKRGRRRSYSGSESEEDYRRGGGGSSSRHHRSSRRSRSRSRERDRYESSSSNRHRRSSPRDSRSSRNDRPTGSSGTSSSSRVEYYTGGTGSSTGGTGSSLLSSAAQLGILTNPMNSYQSRSGMSSNNYRQ